jgi:quercetin 2,3-dioxygenase
MLASQPERISHFKPLLIMNTTTPAIAVRASAARGHANHGWLDTYHTFSFSSYYDPEHMGFRTLRVINQDRVVAGAGFPTHPHRDMEIFSYVLEGAISHKDSMGNARELKPGQIQLMSAGSGVTHSEFNPSKVDPLHLLQIWIEPNARGLTPTYTEWHPTTESESLSKVLVISPDGRENSAFIHQDAFIYRLRLEPGESVTHELSKNRGLWLQAIDGDVRLNGTTLRAGDGASAEEASTYEILAGENPVEALLFDLA